MSDLRRLFSLIVHNIAAVDASRLYSPVTLGELMQRIAPYRSSRRHLDVVTSEEYELLILRLAAGEEGLARLEPPETLARFRRELGGVHPDLHILVFDEAATLTLSREAVTAVLGGTGERGFAPPGASPAPVAAATPDAPTPAPTAAPRDRSGPGAQREPPGDEHPPIEEVEILEWEAPGDVHADRCGFCGGSLPVGRTVNFCPHCGQSLRALHCPQCNEEVELGWRHCVSCGAALAEP
ncbi:MAG: zinc ribbon domain-containing protein [Gemmatimonadota bacterium]